MRPLILAGVLTGAIGCNGSPTGPKVRIEIPRGATLDAAADTLKAHGVIESPRFFRWYALITGREREVRAGIYELPQGSSVPKVFSMLASGRVALQRLVVPEGLMLREIAQLANQQFKIPPDSFLAATADQALLDSLGVKATSLEGYLYPSTYVARVGSTAREVVHQMVDEFRARWKPEWNARLDSLRMTRHQLVTLASIIEGEVRYGPDRGFVSSVYHNRLRRGMRLQADPTVIYALGVRRRLYEKDYRFPSKYNTYLIDGLPPGPIGQPSDVNMEAALYPERSNFLYFVAGADGKHIFSRTLREHLVAIATIRRRG